MKIDIGHVIGIILVVILAYLLFNKNFDKLAAEMELQRQDSIIKVLNVQAAEYKEDKEFHRKQASDIIKRIGNNKIYYIESKQKYDKVPDDVLNIRDKDSLRRAIEEHYK